MARMIPEFIDYSIKSGAERKIFSWFKDSPDTKDWIVLFSEKISEHVKLVQGEIDFLILAPNKGIFSIEVKGGRVRSNNGLWEFTDRNGNINTKSRSPFEQASEGMFSVRKYLIEKFPNNNHISRLLFGYGVMFPDIVFEVESPEYSREIVFDSNFGKDVGRFVSRLHKYFNNKLSEKYGIDSSNEPFSRSDAEKLSEVLRPNFESYVSISKLMNDSEESIASLTNEQYNVLDQIGDNKRILVLGGAGTGKTILALNALKRFRSENSERAKTAALLCFNSNLGDWLSTACGTSGTNDFNYVGSFHSLMLKIVNSAHINIKTSTWEEPNFYDQILPCLTLDALKITPLGFDEIYIDEAQDIFNLYYFSVIDALLSGGIRRGRWIMFADFENQNIFLDSYRGEKKALDFLEEWGHFAVHRLNINCRNTEQICREIESTSQIRYKTILNQIHGAPVNYFTYNDKIEQKNEFVSLVENLEKEHILKNSVVVLSPYNFERSIVSETNYKFEQYNSKKESKKVVFSFSTIQAFKGLESKIIIVVDIDENISDNLLYIAYSRARSLLYVFETKGAHTKQIKRFIDGGGK